MSALLLAAFLARRLAVAWRRVARADTPLRFFRMLGRQELSYLGLSDPQVEQASERSPPNSEAWPAHASLPLTYRPVSDLA